VKRFFCQALVVAIISVAVRVQLRREGVSIWPAFCLIFQNLSGDIRAQSNINNHTALWRHLKL